MFKPKLIKITFYSIISVSYLLYAFFALAQFSVPPGQAVTLTELEFLIARIANFFIFISVLLAVIAIIVSGLMYLKAGNNTDKLAQAKKFFWNGIIGSLIILGVGVILNTVAAVITREAFCTFRNPITGTCLY